MACHAGTSGVAEPEAGLVLITHSRDPTRAPGWGCGALSQSEAPEDWNGGYGCFRVLPFRTPHFAMYQGIFLPP